MKTTWRVRVQHTGHNRDVIVYTAETKQTLREMLVADETIVFAETTGGDGHTANDMLIDRR